MIRSLTSLLKQYQFWIHDYLFNEGAIRKHLTDIEQKLGRNSDCYCGEDTAAVIALQSILDYAVKNTKYYSRLSTNSSLSDFPVLNKAILNENYHDFLVQNYKNQKTHTMHTSGSTGIPFTVIQDMNKRNRHIADLKYFGELAGYKSHDPMCYLRAKPTATQKDQNQQNIWQLDICNLSEENLTRYFKFMVDKRCTALIAYPSTLETAVTLWAKRFRNETCIKTIISTSETLTSGTRQKLKDFFGDHCKIRARYSNTENGVLGQECEQEGVYILNWASYYFELLKLDCDEPTSEGELGRIVITDLYNRAFPMIRYDTGDVGKMMKQQYGFPRLSELYGRRMDLIYDTKHEVVSPFLLCRTMRLTKGIDQWQFIQNAETEYIIRITVTKDGRPSCTKEIAAFKQVLGENADIIVEYVKEIPVMSSLKRKLIVSNLEST